LLARRVRRSGGESLYKARDVIMLLLSSPHRLSPLQRGELFGSRVLSADFAWQR
jgi:hypothetical protein